VTTETPATGLALDDFWTHDPFVLPRPEQGVYLLYTASREEPVVHVYTSSDLETWSGPQEVFRVPEGSWADPTASPWAPEVHEHDGRFFLFTTLHQPATRLPAPRAGGTEFTITDRGEYHLNPSARGTVIAVADDPRGPFELVDPTGPVTPPDFMTLDGTLFVDDDDRPWMVYAHEWVQILDGTIEAIPLTRDLSGADGDPVLLFRGSEAAFLRESPATTASFVPYVTDGPQFRRLDGGALLMIWATYRRLDGVSEYVETTAVSRSGSLLGPWEQGPLLVDGNAGHGMLFDAFDGTPHLILHRGMGTPRVRAELHRVRFTNEGVELAD
jgi:hypothetical protein